jgi:tetratricopeptide (TPR) repeat protein
MRNFIFCLLSFLPLLGIAQKKYKEQQKKAFELLQKESYQEAILIFDELIKQKPKIVDNYYWKGLCLVRQGKNGEAINMLNMAIEKNDKNWLFYKSRGDAYYNSTNYQNALKDYQRAIDLEPTKQKDTLFWYIADTYRKLNQYEKAIENYSKAIQINSNNPDLYYHKGFCYSFLTEREKYKEQACSDYQKAFNGGIKNAQTEAWEIFRCDFARPTINKDNTPIAISKVEIEPLTGASIVSKGIGYERIEIYAGKSENSFLISSEIANKSDIIFKIIKPIGFRQNEEDKILFGTDFAIYEKDKLLHQSEDLYKDDFTGVDAEMLKSLKLTITLDNLQENTEYSLLAHFFDKQSNAEISISLPFVIKLKTRTDNILNSSFGVLGQGTASKSVGDIEIERIEWRQNQKIVGKLKANQPFDLWLWNIKKLSEGALIEYAWFDTQNGKKIIHKKTAMKFSKTTQLKDLIAPSNSGRYIFWLRIVQISSAYKSFAFTAEMNVD